MHPVVPNTLAGRGGGNEPPRGFKRSGGRREQGANAKPRPRWGEARPLRTAGSGRGWRASASRPRPRANEQRAPPQAPRSRRRRQGYAATKCRALLPLQGGAGNAGPRPLKGRGDFRGAAPPRPRATRARGDPQHAPRAKGRSAAVHVAARDAGTRGRTPADAPKGRGSGGTSARRPRRRSVAPEAPRASGKRAQPLARRCGAGAQPAKKATRACPTG